MLSLLGSGLFLVHCLCLMVHWCFNCNIENPKKCGLVLCLCIDIGFHGL